MVERWLRTGRMRGGLLAAVMSVALGVGAFISPAQATVAAGGVFAEDPPEPEAIVVELSVDRAEVDVNNPTSTFTVTPSGPVPASYYLSVYDDTGRRVYLCSPGYACANGGAVTFTASTPNNATRTYTAYVAQDAPSSSVPTVGVLAVSSVSVANLGWTGTLTLTANRYEVDANDPNASLTVAPSVPIAAPYIITVYDDTGRRVYFCAAASGCTGGGSFSASTPNNTTRVYTAYVSQDLPTTGPPVSDVRAPVSITVANLGWTGHTTLQASSASVNANNPNATFTLSASKSLVSPYYMSVYDETGRRVFVCGYGAPCQTTGVVTFSASTPNNETRTYTAYVAQDLPEVGPPTVERLSRVSWILRWRSPA